MTERPEWIEAIRQMQFCEKQLPDEPLWAVGAAQNLADVVADLAPTLTMEQRAVLIGVGAMLVREGNKETMAGITGMVALDKLREKRK